jgi:hypothetical protein
MKARYRKIAWQEEIGRCNIILEHLDNVKSR